MEKSPLGVVASNGKLVSWSDIDNIEQLIEDARAADMLRIEHEQAIAHLNATISNLTARLQALAPNLSGILPQLLEAGLTAWADRAVATYNESHLEGADSLMPIVAQIYAAASSNDIAAVPPLFSGIMQRSMVAPTPAEATAMQAVLDGVKFPSELINFYPWIEQ